MKINSSVIPSFICAALTLSAAAAPQSPADSTARDFGFGKMEIYKFDKGTIRLKSEDLDGDGKAEIIFLNRAKSRLEILFRRDAAAANGSELLEDVYIDSGMMLDQQVSMYRLADFNNDGLKDILTIGNPLGLFISYQQPDRKFTPPAHIFLTDLSSIMCIQTGDINEDGLTDIIVSRRTGAEILWNDKDRSFLKRKDIPYINDKAYWLELIDADADGHLDLLQYYNSNETPLQMRHGNGEGAFGLANSLRAPRMRSITVIPPRGDEQLMLAGIMNNGLGMRLYGFEQKRRPELLQSQEITPATLAVPDKDSINHLPWVTYDFNHDGYDDLLVSAPTLSRLYLYRGTPDGLNPSPEKCDSLSKVSGLTLLKNGDVLAVSLKEKTVAIHRHKDLKSFPEFMPVKGELVTAGAISGTDDIFVIRRSDDKLYLDRYSDTELKDSHPLELDNDPVAMRVYTMPQGETAVLLFIEYATPEMLLIKKTGIEKLKPEQFRALSQNLKPFQITAPQAGDGSRLIVAQGATIRDYEWKDGSYRITKQYNPVNEHAEAVFACSYAADGKRGIMAYDRNSRNLLWYPEGTTEPQKIHLASNTSGFEGITQLKNRKNAVLMLAGTEGIALIADKSKQLSLKEIDEYMSQSEKPSLRFAQPVQIGKPPRPAIAMVDANNRSIEIVSCLENSMRHELTFPVFLRSDMVGPVETHTTEPHDVTSGDINGDGIDEMILLVHDNLIIYPGE